MFRLWKTIKPTLSCDVGAITIVETLIAMAVGIAVLIVWAQGQAHKHATDQARQAGRYIAAYSRAASVMLAETPPSVDRKFDVNDLQNCDDIDARQFLPCTFSGITSIPYATKADGTNINFDDLIIDAKVTPDGVTATIDLGIFRAGDDNDNDGLSDSRPDLAAMALNVANEESGAGTLSFYLVEHMRQNLEGLTIDPEDANFDQAKIDELAGLRVFLGASVRDAPFLRLDGSNEMTGGITFVNEMSIEPDGKGLTINGGGDISLNSGDIISTGNIEANSVEFAMVTVNDILSVDVVNGVQGAGFDRLDQSKDIVRIDGDVLRIGSEINQLSGDVKQNNLNSKQNRKDLVTQSRNTKDNQRNIATNQKDVLNSQRSLASLTARLTKLENKSPSSPPVCSPSRSQIIHQYKGKGYNYNSHEDSVCWVNSDPCYIQSFSPRRASESYQVRDVQTLKCRTYGITFYTYCSKRLKPECRK